MIGRDRRAGIAGMMAIAGIVIAGVGCGSPSKGSQVRLTLDDGQVVVGDVRTAVLPLQGALGTLEIPLEDVGEVVPVEGYDLGDANGQVTVWLRNGTELRGRWTDPELAMGLAVGGSNVGVSLPLAQMVRFQTPGAEAWPNSSVFRVKTIHGDDLLVDPASSTVTVNSALGSFSPFLSECVSLAPVGAQDGPWRIELTNGSVLVGPLAHDALEFAMPLGPDRVRVPLANVVTMAWQDWGSYETYATEAPAAARAGWFDNKVLGSAKSAH